MSATPSQAPPPIDPLDALRSADARPFAERWRESVQQRFRTAPAVRAFLGAAAVVAVAALILYRSLVVATDPPIEDSLPVATSSANSPTETSAGSADAAGQIDDVVGTVVVHVAGAVRRPGLVQGSASWRVDDAIQAAGGPGVGADLDRINLAALIVDGQRIYVPLTDEVAIPEVEGSAGATDPVGPVDINSADEALLQTLPGVGPATAATIVAHRAEHGPFGSVDALVAVRGIGPATLEALRDLITVR